LSVIPKIKLFSPSDMDLCCEGVAAVHMVTTTNIARQSAPVVQKIDGQPQELDASRPPNWKAMIVPNTLPEKEKYIIIKCTEEFDGHAVSTIAEVKQRWSVIG
jgi:hypothetical protein